MRRQLTRTACSLLLAFYLVPASLWAQSTLDIEPVYQQTPVWCWAAVGEMVFRHNGVANINPFGNFQCGIIALLHPVCDQNCFNCVVPAGSLATMNNMLTQYPRFASQHTGTVTHIRTTVRRTRLSLREVQRELDDGRPIVAGISPSGYRAVGVSEHVALIIGYDEDELLVNDPFPFGPTTFAGNPYLAAGGSQLQPGRYLIRYSSFVTRLQWRETIYDIRCTGSGCAASDPGDRAPPVLYGRSCQTPAARCGPFYNQPALPVGSACWCQTPYGPANGQVVQP